MHADVPPPLSSLPEQLQALELKGLPKAVAAGEEVPDSDLPTASTTIVGLATKGRLRAQGALCWEQHSTGRSSS